MTGGVGEASAAKPPPQTDAEVLARAVAELGPRFRELLDANHPDYDPRYWPLVRGLAAGGTPPAAAAAFDPGLHRRMARCPARVRIDCGCAWPWGCSARGRAAVSQADCYACLRAAALAAVPPAPDNCSGESTPASQDGGPRS